jgi:hypothetical protein
MRDQRTVLAETKKLADDDIMDSPCVRLHVQTSILVDLRTLHGDLARRLDVDLA